MWRYNLLFNEIFRLIIESAESAFIEVTAFVGGVLLIFGYINYVLSGKLVESIGKSKKAQPIIGSLLGLTPGCGGAIFVMPLFPQGVVSFGTIVATLIATMGDSAFVLMSVNPLAYLWVSILSFLVAIVTGYLVDLLPIGQKLFEEINLKRAARREKQKQENEEAHEKLFRESGCRIDKYVHVGHVEGDDIDMILHHNIKGHQDTDSLGYKITHKFYPVYWLVIGIGLVLGIMDLFRFDLNELFIPNLGSIVGVTGTTASIFMMIMSKKFIQDDTHEEVELKAQSFKETIIHNAQETAFVAMWVFAAYLVYEFFVLALGKGIYVDGEALMSGFLSRTGLSAVIMGVLIGIIPGCGPQIIFVSLFIKGFVPFSALLANAISQDGDALFPLLAIDRKSSLWATIFNTVTALIVGVFAYYIEVSFF